MGRPNLKNQLKSELVRQRRNGQHKSRHDYKKQNNAFADYDKIYSNQSYRTHVSRLNQFADWLKKSGLKLKQLADITPQIAQRYLVEQYQAGKSAWTISADSLALNHVMIGSRNWTEQQKLSKSQLKLPKRSLDTIKNNRSVNATEWQDAHKRSYQAHRDVLDTVRSFGLRREEIVPYRPGAPAMAKSTSIFADSCGNIYIAVVGKGGKVRLTHCLTSRQRQMQALYGRFARPLGDYNPQTFRGELRADNDYFYECNALSNIPTHIFRADYAQNRLIELKNTMQITRKNVGYTPVYHKIGTTSTGKNVYQRNSNGDLPVKPLYADDLVKIGPYQAPRGVFLQLASDLGHNRLDVLRNYLR